ncbi:transposon ty3-i Gag-Pol polyprotein [Plakobranchus ocellatus]|uniref:Transposon ty3-i Gag-Pol polyprotein n=1 Tax=Plakobranchus ocellatus TaxID=259542 RepID=A0AAV4AJK8_9GAST|nr:transposon ty3-i Gag-Pol polyprotein [Plakobranchus ocellatus]
MGQNNIWGFGGIFSYDLGFLEPGTRVFLYLAIGSPATHQDNRHNKPMPDSSFFMSKEQRRNIDTEIENLLEKRVITKSKHEPDEFISGIFTREKPDGSHRMILNLKEFNKKVEYKKFKMETLKCALNLVTPQCWLASVDLVSAYYSVPIERSDRKYLKFLWRGRLYEYTVYMLQQRLGSVP